MIFTYLSSAYWGGGTGGRILDSVCLCERERARVSERVSE